MGSDKDSIIDELLSRLKDAQTDIETLVHENRRREDLIEGRLRDELAQEYASEIEQLVSESNRSEPKAVDGFDRYQGDKLRLESVVRRLKDEYKINEKQKFQLSKEVEHLKGYIKTVEEGKVARVEQEKVHAASKMSLSMAELNACKSENETLQRNMMILEGVVQEREDELKILKTEISMAENKERTMGRAVQKLTYELELKNRDIMGIDEEVKAKLNAKDTEIESLKWTNQESIRALQQQVDLKILEMRKSIKSLTEDVELRDRSMETLQDDNVRLKDALDRKHREVLNLREENMRLDTEVSMRRDSVEIETLRESEKTMRLELYKTMKKLERVDQKCELLQKEGDLTRDRDIEIKQLKQQLSNYSNASAKSKDQQSGSSRTMSYVQGRGSKDKLTAEQENLTEAIRNTLKRTVHDSSVEVKKISMGLYNVDGDLMPIRMINGRLAVNTSKGLIPLEKHPSIVSKSR